MNPDPIPEPDVTITLTAQEVRDWLKVARENQRLGRTLADRQNAARLRFTGQECTALVTGLMSAGNLIEGKLAPHQPPTESPPCPTTPSDSPPTSTTPGSSSAN